MSETDFTKEQIAYLKVWLGILVVSDISLIGWLASNIASSSTILIVTVVIAAIAVTAGVVLLHKRIEQRIESLENQWGQTRLIYE